MFRQSVEGTPFISLGVGRLGFNTRIIGTTFFTVCLAIGLRSNQSKKDKI